MTLIKCLKIYVIGFVVFFTFLTQAGEIIKYADNKVIIKTENEEFIPDEQGLVTNKEGKKVGLIKIIKVKKGLVLGEVIKGKVAVGDLVSKIEKKNTPSSSKTSKTESNTEPQSISETKSKSDYNHAGVLIGVFQNNMNIEGTGNTQSFKDMSMGLSGFVDIFLTENLDLRGKAGVLQYSAANGSQSVSLVYLSLEGSIQYYLTKQFWIGGGGAFLLTVSKQSNIPGLDVSSSTNSFFFGGIGVDIYLNQRDAIPIVLDYILFPSGSGITANSLAIRTGYLWTF